MKKAYKTLLLFTIYFVLVTSTNTLYSFPDNQIDIPNLDAVDSTPPVIIFDLSDMSSNGILRIKVYDTETNLSEVVVKWNGVELTSPPNISIIWYYVVYNSTNTQLSVKNDDSESTFDVAAPDSNSNSYDGAIDVDEVFIPGDHNDIEVEAENLDGTRSYSTTSFCNSIDCWGRGGGSLTTETPSNTLEVQTGIPIMVFNMTGYYCCGYIEPRIESNGSSITNFTISYNETANMLSMTVLTENGYFYKSALLLDPTVDLNLFGCDDCSCLIDETETTDTPSYLFITILSSVFILTTIVNLRKHKSKK